MAKEQKPLPDPTELAFRLFEKVWAPNGKNVFGKDDYALSAMCFAGVNEFLKVATQLREGRSPEDILARGLVPALPSISNVTPLPATGEISATS